MHEDWSYTMDYGIFGHEVKATERSPPDNLTRWTATRSRGLTERELKR